MVKLSGINTRSIGISHQVVKVVYHPLKILHSKPFIEAVYSFGILWCKYWRHKTINSIRQLQIMHGVCISDHKSYRFEVKLVDTQAAQTEETQDPFTILAHG